MPNGLMLEHYQTFYLNSPDDLRQEVLRLGLNLSVSDDLSALSTPLSLGAHVVSHRLWLQPIQGFDAEPSGAPGPLTKRRYQRYAEGGYALLWIEATAAGEANRDESPSLCLSPHTLPAFRQWVDELRVTAQNAGTGMLTLILQMTVLASEEDEETLYTRWVTDCAAAATLAAEAGFDGVDIKCCYGDALFHQLKQGADAGHERPTHRKVLKEIIQRLHEEQPQLLLATRLSLYTAEPFPNGYGVQAEGFRKLNLTEPLTLLKELQEVGLSLLNLSACSPNIEIPDQPLRDIDAPQEHPLMQLQRTQDILKEIKDVLPDLHLVGGGLSWLRHFLPHVAAAWLRDGLVSGVGFARSAMAYPMAAQDILTQGAMQPSQTCMACGACTALLDAEAPTGCVIRDAEIYGGTFRHMQRFDLERLQAGARRCHNCENAPCMAASPSRVDLPSMIRHFAAGRFEKAYTVLRKDNVFPALSAHLCPSWLQAEGACIETIFRGESVPIGDIQLTLARWALETLNLGLRLPDIPSGKKVGVVGGGPTGLAASVRLLEAGHEVRLFEREQTLGGTPENVIPASRFPGALDEVEAVLKPALEQGRLEVRYGEDFGNTLELNELVDQYDAVLLAMGLSDEASIGHGPGVVDALTFLREVKKGGRSSVPPRVAVLSGGDCAMDAAQEAQALGAEEVFIVFEGPRAAMHWHMNENWFANEGVHCLILTRPLEYVFHEDGRLLGLRIVRMEPHRYTNESTPVADSENILPVDLVIEAMGLSAPASLVDSIDGLKGVFTAGALCNGGASVEQCISEGMAAADQIHHFLTDEN